jgi:hypothetical protein
MRSPRRDRPHEVVAASIVNLSPRTLQRYRAPGVEGGPPVIPTDPAHHHAALAKLLDEEEQARRAKVSVLLRSRAGGTSVHQRSYEREKK